ncbi:MAG: hypothetical protein HY998_01365 [candidate division NC10 bacterium]|nr:hypothetical protein [candidate division NC10 bacterium]
MRGGDLDKAKPDLLVHVPGEMNHNLAVIEIKPLRPDANPAEAKAIRRDLRKLIAFRGVGYAAAFLIVFGEPIDRVRQYGRRSQEAGIDIGLVELYHHPRPRERARTVHW